MSYYDALDKAAIRKEVEEAGAGACREGKGPSYNPYLPHYGNADYEQRAKMWITGYSRESHKYD